MGETFVGAGIACLIAAVIGGGLSAFGVTVPVISSRGRQVLIGLLGVGLILVGLRLAESDEEPPSTLSVEPERLLVRHSQIGGPFVIIGPNPGGEFAAQGYWWHEMNVLVENECSEPFHVDPSRFHLYLSPTRDPSAGRRYEPTRRDRQYGENRLAVLWLQQGERTEGRLIYEVPEKLPDGTATNGAYHILRYSGQMPCPVVYSPY